jgi:hypothetical protein
MAEKRRCLMARTHRQAGQPTPFVGPGPPPPEGAEEVLVADARAGLTPADLVERKLVRGLRGAPVGISHMHTAVPGVRGRIRED